MEAQGKKIIILVENMYNEFEFWYPYYRLKEAGAEVTVVGGQAFTEYQSKMHLPVKSDAAAEAVKAEDFDGIVIPGGYAPDVMRRHQAMVDLVRDFNSQGKPVAAICHAGWMLCSADIVKGRKTTCFFSIKDDLTHAGAQWVDAEVVVDGNLITSRTPDDLPAFMRAFLKAL